MHLLHYHIITNLTTKSYHNFIHNRDRIQFWFFITKELFLEDFAN